MSNIIERIKFHSILESVKPGVSAKEVTEQSSCFIFCGGKVLAFNEEVYCEADSGLNEWIKGAVAAKPLLALLDKMNEDVIEVVEDDSVLAVIGKKRRADFRMTLDLAITPSVVTPPEEYQDLHPEFCNAIEQVQSCAGTDDSKFTLTCVHVHPKWVEACDNGQLCRYQIKTGFTTPTLIRRDAIKHVTSMGMTEFAESENWVHFRNPQGLILACRRYTDLYEDLSQFLEVTDGVPTTLPSGLADAAARCEVFSGENIADNLVVVEIANNKFKISGEGSSGRFTETKKTRYAGPPLAFTIPPKMLVAVTERHAECILGSRQLKVDGGKWVYVSCLNSVE